MCDHSSFISILDLRMRVRAKCQFKTGIYWQNCRKPPASCYDRLVFKYGFFLRIYGIMWPTLTCISQRKCTCVSDSQALAKVCRSWTLSVHEKHYQGTKSVSTKIILCLSSTCKQFIPWFLSSQYMYYIISSTKELGLSTRVIHNVKNNGKLGYVLSTWWY